jgi:hypothetical protein
MQIPGSGVKYPWVPQETILPNKHACSQAVLLHAPIVQRFSGTANVNILPLLKDDPDQTFFKQSSDQCPKKRDTTTPFKHANSSGNKIPFGTIARSAIIIPSLLGSKTADRKKPVVL